MADAVVGAPYSYSVGSEVTPTQRVGCGEPITMHVKDASGDQIREGVELSAVERESLFPVAGPVHVAGVEPGDVLRIRIDDLHLPDVAHTWTRPGLGFGLDIPFHVRRVDLNRLTWPGREHVELPLRAHVGTLGVLSGERGVPARDVGPHGGNIDFADLGADAELWVTANVEGGGVFAGDVHASIGDGEICGTGLEAPATVVLRAERHRPRTPVPLPMVVTGGRTWLVGTGDTVEQALELPVQVAVEVVSRQLRLSREDAYLLASQLLRVDLCQVVNPHASVAVTLQQGLDQAFVPHFVPSGTREEQG